MAISRKIFTILALISLLSVAAFAELFGPLGKVMHSMDSSLSCAQNGGGFLCFEKTPEAAADELVKQAELLSRNPGWVFSIFLPAESAPELIQSASLEVTKLSRELMTHAQDLKG